MEDKKKEKLFMRDFFRKAGKAIYDYELIEPGDRILVGVSGGKDSLALLEVLALRARDPKQNYTVVAAHIAVENVAYEVDGEYVRQFCEQLGVEFIHRTIDYCRKRRFRINRSVLCVRGIAGRPCSGLRKNTDVINWPWDTTGTMPSRVC